jgi:hypothetical protein
MAAPLVSAAAAMLRAKDSDLTYTQIKDALREHTTPLASLSGKTVSGGLLNVAAAVSSAH